MGSVVAGQENVVGRRRGYLALLGDDDEAAQSYLFAVGRAQAKGAGSFDVTETLVSCVVRFGASWNNGEDVQVVAGQR